MADEVNDDVVRPHTVHMRKLDLSEGRSVAVGYADDTDNVFVRFVNNQGTETKLMVSPEAASALHRLLSPRSTAVNSAVWQLVAMIADGKPDPAASAS